MSGVEHGNILHRRTRGDAAAHENGPAGRVAPVRADGR
ncbi:putative protein without homology [Propionibacterium freudenreichii subsp. shermanii]|nr:putative protein without homology [Propionibacterium freudenreichii subsp. shermanii]